VRPDLVYAERWRTLEFLPENLDVPLISDPTDSMTLYNQRLLTSGSFWERVLGWEEHWKFSRCEGGLAKRSNATVFCSRVDMEYVKSQASDARYELVPNGVDTRSFFFKDECEEERGTIVFTGSLKYRPNLHGVRFFLDEVFPLIRKEEPAAKFMAVGNGAKNALANYRALPGFQSIDFVPDLRPYLAKAQVAVAPITVGSGVSNKLAEGFSVGTPVVATPMACGDLPLKSGEQLLIARGAPEFAKHVVTLLRDSGLCRKIALCGRRFVVENYDWEMVSAKMESLICEIGAVRLSEVSTHACSMA
jgi:glycosyltransferase involved in cell wall biosynthesis